MTGFYPVMMFGLPAACVAMYHSARRKRGVGGLLLSMGLTSFLTGVTEPVEFTFMFRAPLLYLLHAVMTGVSMAFMDALGVRLGFTFSAGGFDFLLGYGLSTHGWLVLPVGAAYALVYYGIFRWAIERFDLQTPGREPAAVEAGELAAGGERGAAFVLALGGAENLLAVDACMTRLRLSVADSERIDDAALTALGARGIVRPAAGSVQVVVGPQADQLADTIRAALRGGATGTVDRAAWLAALGGADNVKRIEVAATTRLRVELASPTGVDEAALGRLGAQGVMPVSERAVHVVVGPKAEAIAQALRGDS
jgi:PTS system N-acetylglucosamine-specific IIC component